MAAGVLYTYPENFRAYKALIAAQYSGVDVKVAPNFVFGETNKSEEFLKKFPAGKVPAFESADGKVLLTESNAIAYYVSNAALRGGDPETQARVWQWASWADSELLPASCAWVFPYLGIMQFNKQHVERARADLLCALRVLDAHLLTRTFLVTERVTLADVVVYATLLHAFAHALEPATRAALANVTRWFLTVSQQPAVRAAAPPPALAAAAPVYDPKKFQDLTQKKDGGKKDKKSEKKAESAKKKEEAPPADELDEDEKPKEGKDPFDLMPKGNGDLAKPTGGPRGRQWATNKWRELSAKLNSDGTGESRSEEKWRKVWTDFKNNTKRKAAKLNRSMTGTGGGPALKLTLTDLELRVLAIMGEQAATGMTTISEVGFLHIEQDVELVSQDVDSNQIEVTAEESDLGKEPSPQLDRGDEDWNLPGTSQEQPSRVSTPAPARKWTPLAKKTRDTKTSSDGFLKAERDRDKMYYELEKERIRQRDFELELQAKWLAFMNEVLNKIMKFMEEKRRDE